LEYFLNDLQKTVKQMARTIAEEKILPVRAELDESKSLSPRSMAVWVVAAWSYVWLPRN